MDYIFKLIFVSVVFVTAAAAVEVLDNTQYKCPTGEIIPTSYLCEGNVDCGDWSDESVATCGVKFCDANDGMLSCNSSYQCYLADYRCDKLNDCYDKSDEENCPPESVDGDKDEKSDEDSGGFKSDPDDGQLTTTTVQGTKTSTTSSTTKPTEAPTTTTTMKPITAKIEIEVSSSTVNPPPKKCFAKPLDKKCADYIPQIASKLSKRKFKKCSKKPEKKFCKKQQIVLAYIQRCFEQPLADGCDAVQHLNGKNRKSKNKRNRKIKKSGKKSGGKKSGNKKRKSKKNKSKPQ